MDMCVNTSFKELTPAACRVCLAVDVRLHTIADTPLQLVYEKLTNISLHTADKRPVAACFMCYALLYKSGKLLLTAAKAEKLLTDLFDRCSKITTESISFIDREANGLAGSLAASRAEYFDNIPPIKVENLDEIKAEPTLEDDYTEMEFEHSICYSQTQHEDAYNKNHNCEDEIPVNSFIKSQQSEAAGELLVEKKIQKDEEVEKHRVKKRSNSRQWKHGSGESRMLTDEGRYTCNDCQKTFNHKRYLTRHLTTRACKKYQCDTCQKQFKNPTYFKIHLKVHTTHTSESSYGCKICPSKFNNAGNLNRHIRTMHGKTTFECNICQRKFDRKDYLKSHLKVHSSVKFYECSICKNQFKDQSNYNRHLKGHTDEKPHECNICESKFTLLHHLKAHIRCHSGEKPYKCEHCQMSFNHQSHLRTHTRTHTGEKPFECNICERRFNRRTHLRSHLNIHKKQEK